MRTQGTVRSGERITYPDKRVTMRPIAAPPSPDGNSRTVCCLSNSSTGSQQKSCESEVRRGGAVFNGSRYQMFRAFEVPRQPMSPMPTIGGSLVGRMARHERALDGGEQRARWQRDRA